MWSPTVVAIDSRKRRFGAGDSWAVADAQSKFLPFTDGESVTSPGVSGSTDRLGESCQAS